MSRILLIEDNAMNRDLISRRLGRRGFEVSTALDGAEGIEKAMIELPDLIVMDMGLPVVDGYEAARRLKDSAVTGAIPIVGLSARAMSGDAERARRAGCDDYDTKPIEWPRLLAKITALLERGAEDGTGDATAPASGLALDETVDVTGKHLLVVDPSALRRRILGRKLAALGHRFTTAESGRQALQQLAAGVFDAIFLQVGLPDMSGGDVLRYLRSQPRLCDLPVLMIAGIDERDEALTGLELGARDLLSPPFPEPLLRARLESVLGPVDRTTATELATARRRADRLLHLLLPAPAVIELERTGRLPPRRIDDLALVVLAWDSLAARADREEPEEVLGELQELLLALEPLETELPLRRLELDAAGVLYAVGLEPLAEDPAAVALRCARELLAVARRHPLGASARVGLHAGPATVALLGRRRHHYLAVGATVDDARTVARHGDPGTVVTSGELRDRLGENASGEEVTTVERNGGPPLVVYPLDMD